MKYLFYGIDISKDYLDVVTCDGMSKKLGAVERIDNTVEAIDQFLLSVEKSNAWFCFEHTGVYGMLFESMLAQHDIVYSGVNALEIIRSSGIQRGKSDPKDAQVIATFAATFSHKLVPTKSASDTVIKLKALLSSRELLVKIRTQYKNALKSNKIGAQVHDLDIILEMYAEQIEQHNQAIKSVEKSITSLISSDEKLQKNYDLITSVIGVGPIVAASVLVVTKNFSAFVDPRKFNCYCGIAPFERTSGSSVRHPTKTSRIRNKNLKKLLFNAAYSAAQHDPQIASYFERKKKEGKPSISIINAVACKLVARIFAVQNRQQPFVKLAF